MEGKRGLIDTSVAVALGDLDASRFPEEITISTLTLAELATGPPMAEDEPQRAARQGHLQYIESHFEALPFDSNCARAYGRVYAAVVSIGRKARGARAVDLMIAATALAHGLQLYTLNADDLRGLEGLVEVVDLRGSGD